jgi:hypothetical protein
MMEGVDPLDVLGVTPGAAPEEVTAAYRRLAKRWHPDRTGGDGTRSKEAERRMAEINAAYEALREAGPTAAVTATMPRDPSAAGGAAGPRRPAGHWLPPALRRRLGLELLRALREGEEVVRVERVATWASPTAQVVVTADRLLWLLDDAVANRVRSLDWRHVRAVSHRLRRPLRRTAVVRVDATSGRRFEFAELRPQAALGLAQDIAHAAGLDPAAAPTR